MKKNSRKKTLFLVIGIILIVVIILGATYAYLYDYFNVTNGNITDDTTCFNIDYSITNDAGSTGSNDNLGITGILFPSKNHLGGLFGKISIGINSACTGITGKGSLYLHINSNTSSELLKNVVPHCENNKLETLDKFTNTTDCQNNGGTWVTNGTGLKYGVYSTNQNNATVLGQGYITAANIGKDIKIYDNFTVDNSTDNFYVYVWMDGYVTDESYTNKPFGGYVHASVLQQ